MVRGVSVSGDMKYLLGTAFFTWCLALPAQAQLLDNLPDIEIPDVITEQLDKAEEVLKKAREKEYASLPPKAEKAARLNDLFIRLKKEEDVSDANLIAEEIWAQWLTSGSPSVDLVLRRGTSAEKSGDRELARRMYDQVTTLLPDYAEGYARSARLAYEQEDYNRALSDVTQALNMEPRHFYALWTLGNLLERLNRTDEALEVYKKAHEIYPALPIIKDRVAALDTQIAGDVL